MAKIAPKGKKVSGTKNKDKIVSTGKGVWNKALTVNAGAGNDVINFKKSNYQNTIYGGAGLNYTYGGGNDVLNILTDNVDDLRIFVNTNGWNWDNSNIAIVNINDFTVDNLINFVEGNNHVGLNVSATGGIETLKINGTEVNGSTWYEAIHSEVLYWLNTETPYDSVADAVTAYKTDSSSIDISGLVAAYTSVKYSDVYSGT